MALVSVRVILNRPVIDHMRSWNGDIGHSISRLANYIAGAQIATAPVKTGKLKASIKVGRKLRYGSLGLQVDIGARPNVRELGYAMSTEVGAAPHPIVAKHVPLLRFFWPKVGRWVRFQAVNHPGMIGKHWAVRGMEAGFGFWK